MARVSLTRVFVNDTTLCQWEGSFTADTMFFVEWKMVAICNKIFCEAGRMFFGTEKTVSASDKIF